MPNIQRLIKSLWAITTYKHIDTFASLSSGNASRITNSGKTVSGNTRKLWSAFDIEDWDRVLNGLSVSLDDLAKAMNTSVDSLKDVFFSLSM